MISIITATYNKFSVTKEFYKSLIENPPPNPWEMIWIDDCSTDETRKWLSSLPSAKNKVIFNEFNAGYAASNNKGARKAHGDILVFLNNDLQLSSGWLHPMLESLQTLPKIGMVGNIQRNASTGLIDHAGICFNLVGTGEHHLCETKSTPKTKGAFFPAVTAACCAIRRDTFLAAGGFDESYRNGCEDIDLCLRLGQQGLNHWVDYRSIVIHHVGTSRGRLETTENLRIFLSRWRKHTSLLGEKQWPSHYLRKYRRTPLQYNAIKLIDALARKANLRHGPSAWAEKKSMALMTFKEHLH